MYCKNVPQEDETIPPEMTVRHPVVVVPALVLEPHAPQPHPPVQPLEDADRSRKIRTEVPGDPPHAGIEFRHDNGVEVAVSNGHPVGEGFGPGPYEAIEQFTSETNQFAIDSAKEKFLLTFNPHGYLKKVA